ncbi:MAG: dihydrofolate reductase family protein [Nitrososphaerales archaeon]
MGQVIYYLAMTVDSLIAAPGGDLGWLLEYEHSGEDYGYNEMLQGVDALIMGAGTYEWLLNSGQQWPYEGLDAIVMTSRTLPQPPGFSVRFTNEAPADLVRSLEAKHEKNIWLVGGGKLAAAFADADLIDEYDLTLIPVVLSAGIPLLEPASTARQQKLALIDHQVFPSGVVRLRYARLRA